MRLIDIFSAPPTLVWLLLFVSLFGTTDTTLAFSMIFVGWVGFVARTRLFIITVKDSEFITASKSVGASKTRLIYKHALPGIIGKIATSYVSSIPSIILSISSLAFLGFFKTNKDINLGQIISAASSEAGSNFWILLLPSLILLSISVSLHFIALGVHNDALDPKVIKTK
ncbi:ABC transporter permease subunit [Mycoplasmopsis felis]|uniref:ABC transporter permease subunit n=1 Tax=Mycoplasmopsis felis TaxID=33923 RepID=UPI0021E0A9F5|nr:ABC transporter permease subunit [Mycoplasmopsis felis]MCU9934300.1 ABC transporter permease subunit [Mycoplasmopsis felis]